MGDFGAGGGQYVTYREHIAAKEEAQKRQAALEMDVATLRAALMHVPEDLRKLTDAVQALATKLTTPQGADQTLLAIQRTLDVLSKQQPHSGVRDVVELLNARSAQTGGKTWALVGALAVVAVLLGWQAFIG